MADIKITNLTAGTVKLTDVYPAVDVTDPTQAPSGTTKKYTISQLQPFLLGTPNAYAVMCGGTTSTGALQSIASVGTSGQYLGSNGAAALPTMKSFAAPQVTVYTSGSGTYTTPAGALYLEVQMVGGGSGGSGVGSSGFGSGGNGGDTTFGSLTAGGGADQAGGSASGGDINFIGEAGTSVTNTGVSGAAGGGSAFFGGAGAGGNNGPAPDANGGNAVANSGAGGGAPGTNTGISGQPAGSSGGSVRKTITTPSATYSYGVGAGGAGGTAGVDGATGGNGAAGLIYITAYFQ